MFDLYRTIVTQSVHNAMPARTPTPSHTRLLRARDWVRDTNAVIRAAFAQRAHVTTEKSANDVATETDRAVEAWLAAQIAAAFPGDVLLGEEGGERQLGDAAATGVRWIVDPLDGTFNFVHGFPYIATSIAIERDGTIEAALIANPLTGETFVAERGSGAWLHREGVTAAPERLAVSACAALPRALVSGVLPSSASPSFARVFAAWSDIAHRAASIRRTGAAALDLAHVAAGRLDGFFVMSLAAWDAAAGALLVEEAGGRICDFRGGTDYLRTNEVIAGTPGVSADMVNCLQPHAT